MIIKFDEIGTSILPKFKGGEKEFAADMFFDGTNRIFRGRLTPGATIGMHTHDDSCEMIFILGGHGTILEQAPESAQTSHAIGPGDCLYCPKGHTHSLMNTSPDEDLVFYAAVPKQ